MEFSHKSVLLKESIEALIIKPDGVYCDGTAGGGGHSFEIAKRLSTGRLIAIDRDPDAIAAAGRRLAPFGKKVTLIQANFAQIGEVFAKLGIAAADGILLDLGVSSYQFDEPSRGFSYHYDSPLDMRMSKDGLTAREYINTAGYEELRDVIAGYGEERFASRIAARLVESRETKPIETTLELAELVKEAIPAAARRNGPHPARKTFQAIRIKINGELDALDSLLDGVLPLLKTGGRLAVITFHSLEDRLVKQKFAQWAQGCICPPDFPVCVCHRKPQATILYKKGRGPSQQELSENPRSRSARLRAVEKR